jgi:hypothetical protein
MLVLATSITLSPLGMVSVCHGGQLLLTCERISSWDISVPGTTIRRIIVLSQGVILSPDFRIGFTAFNVARTSESPLISQLLINNVTTEINGSTIYCSEDGNVNNAPMIAINVKYKGIILCNNEFKKVILMVNCSESEIDNVTMVNQRLRSDDVIITHQWPQEDGAVYNHNISPEIPHALLTNATTVTINLTISYNIQYNVSIVSSLCGVTTTRVLNYGKYIILEIINNCEL